jgi:hypothetical protein
MIHRLNQSFRAIRTVLAIAFILTGLFAATWLQSSNPALAASSSDQERYITPDGEDITALVECLPEKLTEGDLQRAIAESGKDYLERVFQTKDDYSEYEISQAEKEFQTCLRRKGITPTVRQS